MPLTKQAHWYALVEEWRLSGSTKRAFCQQRALNTHTFGYWVKKFRLQIEALAKSEASFSSSSSAFVRLDAAQSAPLSAGSEQIEIQLVALTLRLPVTALSETLAQLKQGGWL